MPQYSERERVALAVVYFLQIFVTHRWATAYAAARKHEGIMDILPEGDMTEAQQQEARRMGKKFLTSGTIANAPHQKKINTNHLLNCITPDEAKLAAFILKTGYTEYIPQPHGRPLEEHFYYEHLKQAVEKSPQLKSIYDKYADMCDDVTPCKFMEALYKYDPLLRVRRIHIKYALDEELKQHRLTRAKTLLRRAQHEANFLQRLFFVDECGIVFDHDS
jgi:hypothetical protein